MALELDGPQLRPLANLLIKFDVKGLIPEVYNIRGVDGLPGEIVVSYSHRTYDERYIISRSGIVDRKDVV